MFYDKSDYQRPASLKARANGSTSDLASAQIVASAPVQRANKRGLLALIAGMAAMATAPELLNKGPELFDTSIKRRNGTDPDGAFGKSLRSTSVGTELPEPRKPRRFKHNRRG